MILQPAVLGLLFASLLAVSMLLFAALHGVRILRRWDPGSGGELQLALERRTSLVSTVVGYALGFQLLSLFFFLFTADRLHTLFTGAMCAAGTLNVNGYGYPTLLLKVANFLMAGSWLILDHADGRGHDLPLVRPKYRLLVALAPLFALEAVLQAGYFASMKADVITSCCGSQFGTEGKGVASTLASLPPVPAMAAFYAAAAATAAAGIAFVRTGRGGVPFSLLCVAATAVGIAALVSGFCLYFYEIPTHHCPFCILQREYGYAGYPLYLSLLGGGVAGLGVGLLSPFRASGSMAAVIPPLRRRLAVAAVVLFLLFAAVVTARILWSSFTLGG